MRISNPMISNTMLLNINRNMQRMNQYYNQMSTGKQITVPSDNPILASRALKFRTNVSETEQYQRNVSQGLSWMKTTESAFNNVTSILTRMRELVVQGASDENTYEDRQAVATDMQQLLQQIGTEMNVPYAGRYVFSGYRTDQPPTFDKKQDPALEYTINQNFTAEDLENRNTYQRTGAASIIKNEDVSIVKLAYHNTQQVVTPPVAATGEATVTGSMETPTVSLDGAAVTVVTRPLNSAPDTYNSADVYNTDSLNNTAVYIPETGELVFSQDVSDKLKRGGALDVQYDKSDFKQGELNPIVNFDCTDTTTGQNYTMNSQNMQYEFSVNTRIDVNTLGKDVFTDKMYADLTNFCNSISSMTISAKEDIITALKTADAAAAPPIVRSAEEYSEAADQQIIDEQDQVKTIMQDQFNNILGLIDKHNQNAVRLETDLGSREARLTLIENRLTDDRLNYTELLSDNEDVDYMEVIMRMNELEAVYNASLMTGAKINQTTLANYI